MRQEYDDNYNDWDFNYCLFNFCDFCYRQMTVTLATHCHSRDLPRLHAPGELEALIEGHAYPFDEIIIKLLLPRADHV